MGNSYSKAAAATFTLNKGKPIHRWYSYLEGYSSCLIDDIDMPFMYFICTKTCINGLHLFPHLSRFSLFSQSTAAL